MHLPITLDTTPARPVEPVAHTPATGDGRRRAPSEFVFRGELLDEVADRGYRPAPNLEISASNRRAIATYRMVESDPAPVGRLLDGYI